MDMTLQGFAVKVFDAPLKRPFVTALGKKTSTRNVSLTLRLACGAQGYGEASASLALAHLKPERLARILRTLAGRALGRDAARPRGLAEEAWAGQGRASPAAAAFECALLDAWTSAQGMTLCRWLGGSQKRLETDLTISAWSAEQTTAAAAEAAREGFRVLKIKVGTGPAEDWRRVQAARRAAPKARLLLDGNQGLSVRSALRLVERCLKAGMPLDLLEQPLPKTDWKGMAAITRRCPVPVAADEMVFNAADALRLVDSRAASAINVKVAKSGILRSLDIAAVARAAGLPLMLGCMAETARGLCASVHLAMGTGFFRFVDLDSDHLLAQAPPRGLGWSRRGPDISLD
jgi:L-alanine-DL-glutamate epimerase-like enolase superfamily enzyme